MTSMISRIQLVVVAATAALLAVTLPATPAHAAEFHLKVTGSAGGAGLLNGTLTWESARRAVLSARVTDKCPADGLGVYVFARATFANGKTLTDINWWDGDGCQTSGEETLYGHSLSNPDKRVIKSVVFKLCLHDGWPPTWGSCAASFTTKSYVNPKA
jgi:hypothetical protein